MRAKWIAIIIFIVFVVVGILVLLVWLCRTYCPQPPKENVAIERTGGNSSQPATYLPFIASYPSNRPPIGFEHSVHMPQLAISKSHGFHTNGHADTHPPNRRERSEISSYRPTAPYPLHSDSRKAPYPAETNYYPPANTAPYPLSNSMPQPSTSRIEMNIQETFNSTKVAPPRSLQTLHPPALDKCRIPRVSPSRTRNFPDNSTSQVTRSRRTAPDPPTRICSCPAEPSPPPTYEDAVNKKF